MRNELNVSFWLRTKDLHVANKMVGSSMYNMDNSVILLSCNGIFNSNLRVFQVYYSLS